MVNVEDRIPQNPNQYNLQNLPESGTIILTRADNPLKEGTPINRDLLMKLQGFIAQTTKFNEDGSISQENETGTLTTVFNSDGSITETFLGINGQQIIKTTSFNPDGSISEVITG